MEFNKIRKSLVDISFSSFEGKSSDIFHLVIVPSIVGSIEDQIILMNEAIDEFFKQEALNIDNISFQRLFLSDFQNQKEYLKQIDIFKADCAISIVQQPLLTNSKIALLVCVYRAKNTSEFLKDKYGNTHLVKHNDYTHIFNTQVYSPDFLIENSYHQTLSIFNNLQLLSQELEINLKDHCLRTWFFVRDIDNNYDGMVKARNEVFDFCQMTKDTHFITSTGIEGSYAEPSVLVLLDAYFVKGLLPQQIRFLKAEEYLNPTHEYGVAFERGTTIDYGDQRQIFISGTASINNKGEIVHERDIFNQTRRTFENIKALLRDADAGMDEIACMIVYLRDSTDNEVVKSFIQSNYEQIPYVIVKAPVCRPGWLIEIECIAIKRINNTVYADF